MGIAAPNEHLGVTDRQGNETQLAMQQLWLTGSLLSVGAVLTVRHLFRVKASRLAEAIYSFPLPRDAALRRFKIIGEGFSAESELRKTEEAVAAYEEGLEAGHLSSLVRQYRDGLVNLSLGNIRPGEEVAVFLEIVAGVDLRDDGFRFRFPFTLAPGYQARAVYSQSREGTGATELPEDEFGDVLLPEWKRHPDGLHEVGFDLRVRVQGGIREVGSVSHQIAVETLESGEAGVRLATASDVPNRDLVLDVETSTSESLTLGFQSEGGDGRFVSVVPSSRFGETPLKARNIVFIVDRSGSMRGRPMDQAKRALRACLAALPEEDRFGVVAFDNRVESFRDNLAAGTSENRDRVSRFLSSIEARGGTELSAGLEAGAALLEGQAGDLFLLTDGQVFGGEDILNRARNTSYRVHCLGIGSASQDRFLTLLARSTGGVSRFVTPRERVDLAAAELFSSAKAPVAEQVTVTLAEGAKGSIKPSPSATVYQGVPLVVWGSSECGVTTLIVQWEKGGTRSSLEVPVPIEIGRQSETLKLLQGARLITDFESQAAYSVSERPGLSKRTKARMDRQLEKLSREYGLASRVMSLVAVVTRHGDQPGGVPETLVVPVGMPEDVGFDSYFGGPWTRTAIPVSRDLRMGALAELSESSSSEMFSELPRFGRLKSILRGLNVPIEEPDIVSKAADRIKSEQVDKTGQLFDLAARLRPDGGLGAGDIETRVGRSITLLFILREQKDAMGTSAFDPHIKRLMQFVKASLEQLSAEKAMLAKLALDRSRTGGAARRDWMQDMAALVALYSKKKAPFLSFDPWLGIKEEIG